MPKRLVPFQLVSRNAPKRLPTTVLSARIVGTALALFALMGVSACLPATEKDFQMAQTINEMSDAVNEIRQLSYELQDRLDSLVLVAAKRDTVIRQLANLAGVVVPP